MGKGPTVDRGLKDFLRGVAPFYLNGKAPEFRDAMSAPIEAAGFPLPGDDVFRKILKEVEGVINDQDQPWSLGALVSPAQVQIPVDALPDIEETWKYCLITGQPLTIRQAKWVGRLRLFPRFEDEGISHKEIYQWASFYAGREIAHLAEMAKPQNKSKVAPNPDTRDIDALLILSYDEHIAAVNSGVVSGYPLINRMADLKNTASILADEMLDNIKLMKLPLEDLRRHLDDQDDQDEFASKALEAALASNDATESEYAEIWTLLDEALYVWGFWMQALENYGRNWQGMPDRRMREITHEIYEQSTSFHTGGRPTFTTLGTYFFRPSDDILEEVGYEPPGDSSA